MSDKTTDWFSKALTVVLFLAVFAAIFGLRLWIAGGHIHCVFAEDIGTCVAVSELDDRP